MALYRAMRLRFGYGFESCDASGARNVKNTNIAKHRPIFFPHFSLVRSKELVSKVPRRGQFHAAIRVTRNAAIRVPKLHSLRIFSGYFKPFGLFLFCKVIFGDPPKIPFKTSIKLTSLGLF